MFCERLLSKKDNIISFLFQFPFSLPVNSSLLQLVFDSIVFPFSYAVVCILTIIHLQISQAGCLCQYQLTKRHSPKANELLNIAAIEQRCTVNLQFRKTSCI